MQLNVINLSIFNVGIPLVGQKFIVSQLYKLDLRMEIVFSIMPIVSAYMLSFFFKTRPKLQHTAS